MGGSVVVGNVGLDIGGEIVTIAPVIVRYWLPPLVWAAVILAGSGEQLSAAQTGGRLEPLLTSIFGPLSPETFLAIHFFLRKLTHLAAYGLLGALLFRATRRGVAQTLALTLVVAALDEWHQSTLLTRTGSVGDVVIDLAGAALAVMALRRWAQ